PRRGPRATCPSQPRPPDAPTALGRSPPATPPACPHAPGNAAGHCPCSRRGTWRNRRDWPRQARDTRKCPPTACRAGCGTHGPPASAPVPLRPARSHEGSPTPDCCHCPHTLAPPSAALRLASTHEAFSAGAPSSALRPLPLRRCHHQRPEAPSFRGLCYRGVPCTPPSSRPSCRPSSLLERGRNQSREATSLSAPPSSRPSCLPSWAPHIL